MELGMLPEKLVFLTTNFLKLLSVGIFGKLPQSLVLFLTSRVSSFLCCKILGGNHPSKSLEESWRTLKEGIVRKGLRNRAFQVIVAQVDHGERPNTKK